MPALESIRLPVFACFVVLCLESLHADGLDSPVERLRQTRAVNIEAVVDAQFKQAGAAGEFRLTDPYGPEAVETVLDWAGDRTRREEVCAIRFTGSDRLDYELRGFDSAASASDNGFIVTHRGRCGSCSTLRDLAVYLDVPDLTTPARQCARRIGLPRKKQCFVETIGFTPYCAESWAYNARHTKIECLGTCIADYGLLNLILNRYPGPNVDESGELRPCLQCDEEESGTGFKFSAGRTRRNSGIVSAIPRPPSEIYRLDHSAYFRRENRE